MVDILSRIEALEADAEIRQLAARYCLAVDDRDMDGLLTLFTEDARVHSRDGVMEARGPDAIMKLYAGRFAALGASFHMTHDHVIELQDGANARGIVTAHAEVWREGRAQLAALRYHDRYRRTGGRWLIAEREMLFFYYLEPKDYAAVMGKRERVLTYGEARPADF